MTSAGDAFLAMAERCAKAGPKNCKISTENSTGLGITQWMYSLLDVCFSFLSFVNSSRSMLQVVYDYGKKSGNANFSASGLRSEHIIALSLHSLIHKQARYIMHFTTPNHCRTLSTRNSGEYTSKQAMHPGRRFRSPHEHFPHLRCWCEEMVMNSLGLTTL